MLNDFYIYLHKTPDGRLFYVGKGRGSRASRPSNRNPHWNAVVKKSGGFQPVIVLNGLDEKTAYKKEMQLIAFLKCMGEKLCNITDGGDGGGRNKKRVACVETGEVFESATQAARHFGLSTAAVVLAAQKKRMETAGGKRFFYVPTNADESRIAEMISEISRVPVRAPRSHRRPRSDTHRKKLAKANTGKVVKEETREKIRQKLTALVGGDHFNSKPIVCVSTGKLFPSSLDAAQWVVSAGMAKDVLKARAAISAALVSGRNNSCGMTWARPSGAGI
jgi:hypothetical protein